MEGLNSRCLCLVLPYAIGEIWVPRLENAQQHLYMWSHLIWLADAFTKNIERYECPPECWWEVEVSHSKLKEKSLSSTWNIEPWTGLFNISPFQQKLHKEGSHLCLGWRLPRKLPKDVSQTVQSIFFCDYLHFLESKNVFIWPCFCWNQRGK